MSIQTELKSTLFVQAKAGRLDLNLAHFSGVAEILPNITETFIMKGNTQLSDFDQLNGTFQIVFKFDGNETCFLELRDHAGFLVTTWTGVSDPPGTGSGLVGQFSGSWFKTSPSN